jgi:energy-coupling factor transport system permease protein
VTTMFRGLFHYVDKPSYVHRLDPRVKLLLLVPILLLTMVSNNIFTLALVFSFVILLYTISRIPYHRYKAQMMVSLLSSISFLLMGTFFYFGFYHYYPERPLTIWLWIFRPEDAGSLPIIGPIIVGFTYGRGIVACQEGFIWGIVTSTKFTITFFSSSLVIMTTKPKEILLALNKVGVPIKLTFVAMTALRFIPIVTEEWYVTLNAQRARGLKFKWLNVMGTLRALTAIVSTLIINSIKRARILALAMETRAFGANGKKVIFKELKMTLLDIFLTTAIFVVTVLILLLIFL